MAGRKKDPPGLIATSGDGSESSEDEILPKPSKVSLNFF